MSDVLTDVRFWMQVMRDGERTIVCNPELESRLKMQLERRGLSGQLTVIPSRVCPEGQARLLPCMPRASRLSAATSTIRATLPSPRMVAAEMPCTLR